MKCQLRISKILGSNHSGLIKIASNYFSISAVKDSGVNAVVPLIRQNIFTHMFHILRVLRRFYPHAITFSLHCLVKEDSLGLEGCLWETKWVRKLYPCCGGCAFSVLWAVWVWLEPSVGRSGFTSMETCVQTGDSVFILIMHCDKSGVFIPIQLKSETITTSLSV